MKPLTRKEQFFNYILGKTTSKPKPMTREEKILDEFKPTMVVKFELSKNDYTGTSDKTFEEVKSHIDGGGIVTAIATRGNAAPVYLSLNSHTEYYIDFSALRTGPIGGETNGDEVFYIFAVRMDSTSADGSTDVRYSMTSIHSLQNS